MHQLPPRTSTTPLLTASFSALCPADAEADERALRELAGAQDLGQKIGGGGTLDDPHWAVLKLGWGVLLSQYGAEHAARERG